MEYPEEIWNLLHDGGVAGVTGAVPGDLTIRVEIDYLTRRMQPPCQAIDVTLLGCDSFEYLRWKDEHRTSDVEFFGALEPEILSGSVTNDRVRVICSNGQFDIRYRDVRVTRDDGMPTSIAEIEEVAAAYWDAFGSSRGV